MSKEPEHHGHRPTEMTVWALSIVLAWSLIYHNNDSMGLLTYLALGCPTGGVVLTSFFRTRLPWSRHVGRYLFWPVVLVALVALFTDHLDLSCKGNWLATTLFLAVFILVLALPRKVNNQT